MQRMMLPNASHILELADEYLRVEAIRETALSNRLFGESKKLALLRAGTDLTLSRYRLAVEWFSVNWPDGAEWPNGIARPVAEAAA